MGQYTAITHRDIVIKVNDAKTSSRTNNKDSHIDGRDTTKTDRQTDRHRQTDTQTDRQTDRQTARNKHATPKQPRNEIRAETHIENVPNTQTNKHTRNT